METPITHEREHIAPREQSRKLQEMALVKTPPVEGWWHALAATALLFAFFAFLFIGVPLMLRGGH